jgi:Rrf2 family transcriptional regulator, nitric oxide-sensitive transcriptional repressor
MKISAYADYSLRVLMYLTATPEKIATVGLLSSLYGVSRNHMVKVVHGLSSLGYVKSYKGKGGGVILDCDPDSVRIGDLLREFEKNKVLVECFSREGNTCRITKACRLKNILAEAMDAFFGVLDGYTLRDATGDPLLVKQLLED